MGAIRLPRLPRSLTGMTRPTEAAKRRHPDTATRRQKELMWLKVPKTIRRVLPSNPQPKLPSKNTCHGRHKLPACRLLSVGQDGSLSYDTKGDLHARATHRRIRLHRQLDHPQSGATRQAGLDL